MGVGAAIVGLMRKRVVSAREAYVQALRSGAKPDRVAALAIEAGVSTEQVERDAEVLEQAATLAEAAGQLPAAREDLAAKTKVAEAAQQKLDAEVAKLQALANIAWLAVQDADQRARAARQAVGDLYVLYRDNQELLPVSSAPAVVRERIAADGKSEAFEDANRELMPAHNRMVRARESFEQAAREAAAYTYPYDEKKHPRPAEWPGHASHTALAAAKRELQAATEAYEAAVRQRDEARTAAGMQP